MRGRGCCGEDVAAAASLSRYPTPPDICKTQLITDFFLRAAHASPGHPPLPGRCRTPGFYWKVRSKHETFRYHKTM